jgi:hypothetical protein
MMLSKLKKVEQIEAPKPDKDLEEEDTFKLQ